VSQLLETDRGLPAVAREFSALSVGPHSIWPPVVLAPMAGVTNAPFRTLCRRRGAGLYVSEMITARALVEGREKTRRLARFGPDEPLRSIQLYGIDGPTVGRAVSMLVAERSVDHVDLNFGCPARKVTRHGGGAALPLRLDLFRDIVRAAVAASGSVPVTVKMRLGLDDDHLTYLDAGRIAEGEGATAVALHARTAAQLYSGQARWPAIAALKEAVTSVPVLGNGDIWEAGDALTMMRETGCDGVVVGRGCLGRPWLFADLAAVFEGGSAAEAPDLGTVAEVIREHAALHVDFFGSEDSLREFRKHTAWYLKGYPVGGRTRSAFMQITTLAGLDELLDGLDPQLTLPPGAVRRPRGHQGGPQRVTLPHGWLEGRVGSGPLEPAAESVSSGG
jgi:nifR3 family TIM-barrel protein